MESNFYSGANSSKTPLLAGETFTGKPVEFWKFNSTMVTCFTDKPGTLYIEFSDDKVSWGGPPPYQVDALKKEFHRLTPTAQFIRVRFENTSGEDQTTFNLNTWMGNYFQLTSNLNSEIQSDADALVSRSIAIENEVGIGTYQGFSLTNKFGRAPDIDTPDVPIDLWEAGTLYTGFPTGPAEEFEIVLDNAGDIGSEVTFRYLADYTSTEWIYETVTTTGLNTLTGITGVRCSRAMHNNGASLNVGNINIRHATTTANVFAIIAAGKGQTTMLCDTIPANNVAMIKKIIVNLLKTQTTVISGHLWVRELGKSPVLKRPFSAANNDNHTDEIYSGLVINGFADIAIQIDFVSANSTIVLGNMDYLIKKLQ